MLLPTEAYAATGVAAVALTVIAQFMLPMRFVHTAFATRPLPAPRFGIWLDIISLISCALMVFEINVGVTGPRDSLSNIMPLSFWALDWITQGGVIVLGHVWPVMLSHHVALTLFVDQERAALATLPLSLFVIGCKLRGL